ncbi:MAG: threonine--tRNA ligase [Bacilli bacterium]|nr:threonine--tRNA ligase [Bacilli bacterium]
MINIKENEELHVLNHSCAHLMAQAVKHLYPQAKFWVGPVIDEGFYYDMDLGDAVIKEEDFEKIEREMKKISKDGKRITRIELSKEEAREMFKDDEYKLDLIDGMEEGVTITAYRQGDYTDLCRGPHVETVKEIKFFKLLKTSGAYYKGDSNNKMLQRVYGVCFKTQEDLDKHLYELEEAKKRDHRKLGKELGLFMLSDYGPGLPFWLPNGYVLRRELEDFWLREHKKAGYVFVDTPIMLNRELWETSGHWDHYKDDMFVVEVEDGTYAIKPMNCPGAIQVYNNDLHSYKDLPLRIAELGHVHRYEASGALNGLFRVRGFTQDDAHILLREDQIGEEVSNIIALYDKIYSVFGLNYAIELSTRPFDNYIGNIETWDVAEEALKEACLATGHEFKINPGDGAFYGPKLDFKLRDSLNRIWQCGTIQLDMQLPGRFNCTYIDKNGEKVTPIMIHRACFGSLERFIGIITENYAGAFPTWLAPVQVKILPVNNEYHLAYANEVYKMLDEEGIRVSLDSRDEKLGYRMREAQTKKIPYQLVIGDKEVESGSLNVRTFGSTETKTMKKEEFLSLIKDEIKNLKAR